MTIFFALLMAVLAFAFIAYPFFRRRPRSAASFEDERLQELRSERDTTYSMLKELEFDFQSGILTDEDYRDLETSYKRKAVSILKKIDGLQEPASMEEEIEKQIQELRRGEERFCPQCGKKYQKGDLFCSHCGTDLDQGEKLD